SESDAQRVVPKMVSWWRYFTLQPWIGAYEPQTDPLFKATFDLDAEGRALTTPWVYATFIAPWQWAKPLSREMWDSSLARGLTGSTPPLYWMLWPDADNYRAMGRIDETILSMALSLETARDTVFPKFARTREHPHVGTILGKPFRGTDITDHLDHHLREAIGR